MPAPIQPATTRRWTLEEFYEARDAAPKGLRYEFVDGEVLVTPGPNVRHQLLVFQLATRLDTYVRAQRIGQVITAPFDVELEPRRVILQPDLLVIPTGTLRDIRAADPRAVLLAIETIAPSSARYDRVVKRPRYQRNRVADYWIVDDASATFECWRPDDERPQILAERLVWRPERATEDFTLDIAGFFAEVERAVRELLGGGDEAD